MNIAKIFRHSKSDILVMPWTSFILITRINGMNREIVNSAVMITTICEIITLPCFIDLWNIDNIIPTAIRINV